MNSTQNALISLMLKACEKITPHGWEQLKPHAEHEFRGLLIKLDWVNQMRIQQSMTMEQARIHIDIQKNTMRTRFMALPGTTMIEAEHLINASIDSIREKIYEEMDWVII